MKILIISLILLTSMFGEKLNVTVSIVPQKYFVKKIAKDKVDINVMVKPGFSPEFYEPKTSQMKDLAKSDIYFSIGMPFEKNWLKRFKSANKNLNIVDTSKDIKKLTMSEHFHEEEPNQHQNHSHKHKETNHHHEHSRNNDELDPHIWLDPILVKKQAKTIYEALSNVDSKNSIFYKKNYENFLKELDELNSELEVILKPIKNRTFMVFHPSFGYFANRYNLEQIAVEVNGKEPKPEQLINLIKEAKLHNIKVVFTSPEFSQKSAKVIAKEIDGEVFSMSILRENWDENLIYLAKSIAKFN